jgi:integrase
MSPRRPVRRGINVVPRPGARGTTYRVQWRHPEVQGGKLQASPTFTRRGDAETLADLIADLGGAIEGADPRVKSGSLLADGPDAPPLPARAPSLPVPELPTTLGYWLDRWLDEVASPRSRGIYLGQILRLTPYRERDLAKWSEADTRAMVAELRAHPYANSTVGRTVDRLHSALRLAQRKGAIVAVPVKHSPKHTSPGVALEPGQVARLLDALPNQDSRDLINLLVLTGLRIGEALALEVRDVKPIAQAVIIDATYIRRRDMTGEVKSDNSDAEVYVPDEAWAVLTRRAAGHSSLSAHRLFVGRGRSETQYRRWLTEALERLAAEGDFPAGISFHDMRFTHGGWLLDKKWTSVNVAARLRNTPRMVDQTYRRTSTAAHVTMANEVGELMASGADELASKRRARMREGA